MNKKIFNDPWVIGIGSSTIVVIGASLFGLIEWIKIINWILTSVFGIILISIVTITILYLLIRLLRNRRQSQSTIITPIYSTLQFDNRNNSHNTSDFLKYTKDTFDGINYRWEWDRLNSKGSYFAAGITPFCPRCDCKIIGSTCPNCDSSYYGLIRKPTEVEALIHHRIDNNLYGV